MTPRELWNRLRDRLRRDTLDAELAEELRFHQERLERDIASDIVDGTERASRARRQLGNLTVARESARDHWSLGAVDVLAHDTRQALRSLRKSPGFAVGVILTLALGVGANSAMFGIVDRLMFRAMPYLADPGTVNRVYLTFHDRDRVLTLSDGIEYTRYLDLKRGTTAFSQYAVFTQEALAVGTGADVVEREVAPVSASFFQFFRMRPALGRFFGAADDSLPRGSPVAVLGYDYWQNAFGGANVIGQSLQVGNVLTTIIGVAPRGFSGMNDSLPAAVFLPITAYAGSQHGDDGNNYYHTYHWGWTQIVVRRKPGVSEEQASADLTHAYRASWQSERDADHSMTPLDVAQPAAIASAIKTGAGPDPGPQARSAIWVSGVAALVLLIACANVTNLFLVRAMRRRRERAVRLALGVTRWRLLWQHLTESLVLALLAGAAGMLVAQWGSAGISHFFGYDVSLSLLGDWRVLAMTGSLAILIGVVTGLVPALLSDRADLAVELRSGARAGSHGRARLSAVLLVVQATLSVVSLIGAGLFVRSMHEVRVMRIGFDADPVILAEINRRGSVLTDSQRIALIRRVVEAAQAIPGVQHAAWVTAVPFVSRSTTDLAVEGIDSVQRLGRFTYSAVTADYFATMDTRIRRGRGILPSDRAGAPRVVVVSEGMAGALWPGRDAVGQCIRIGGATDCSTVVGIAEDAIQVRVTDTKNYHYYLPNAQFQPAFGYAVLLRMTGDPAAQLENVRRGLQRVMPGQYYVTTKPLRNVIAGQREPWVFAATMFSAFGILALIVAGIGLYALIAYGVAQRMHELGVRVALGAQRRDILRLIVSRGVAFAAAGTTIGAALALAAGRLVEPLLFRESSRDPAVFAAVALLVLVVAIVASAVPARRASHADPNIALRAD